MTWGAIAKVFGANSSVSPSGYARRLRQRRRGKPAHCKPECEGPAAEQGHGAAFRGG